MKITQTLVSATLLLSVGHATETVPLPPSIDPFYSGPANWELTSPGTILRHRNIPQPLGINTSLASAIQILARSTDSQDRPTAVLTSVFIPKNADISKIVSIQEAYDSPSVDCSPSFAIQDRAAQSLKSPAVEAALKAGLIVAYPDYEGFDAAFTNGPQAGKATLDTLGAVLSSSNVTGICPTASAFLVGSSGGALASEWALELQQSYAPSINISGAVLTALVPNVTSVLHTVDGTPYAGLIPQSLLGLAKQSPDFSTWLSSALLAPNATAFLEARTACLGDALKGFALNKTSLYLRDMALYEPTPQAVLEQVGVMGLHETPKVPMFIYKGTGNEVSPVADSDALVQKYCDNGANIQYSRAIDQDHQTSGNAGLIAGLEWIQKQLSSSTVQRGCNVQNATV